MKTIILLIITTITFQVSISQNFNELNTYEFKSIESYKAEESKVLECANYLFNTPANKSNVNRLIAIQYIMKWMMGSPDYSFEIDQESMELTKGNDDLLGLYMAAMTKVVLENKNETLANDQIYTQAETILVNYCADSNNKMKPSKKIKKILRGSKQ